ncbi:MAG: LL-diaminopimelate aminotransferase [Flavobacterium sp.]|jgi:LL-diaminopimelate aminotransferase
MIEFADRLQSVNEYYFSKKLREVQQLVSQGKPIINMGIGSPDLQPHTDVVSALQNSLNDIKAHQYQSYQGIPEFRKQIAAFYESNYDVVLDSNSEILPLMGSKEGIMHISLAFLNPGDGVLIPNPGYPTYESVAKIVQAKPVFYNLSEGNNWLPDFNELEKLDLSTVKLMWINYPNMPTGAKAKLSDFEKIVDFGKKHNILIINDNPYSFILNDNPISILKTPNSDGFVLELNSLSKTCNMSGWRVGMVLGNPTLIEAILKVKSNMDSGMFYLVQKGAIAAMQVDKKWYQEQNEIYKKRRDLIFKIADKLNCSYDKNTAGLFVWAKIPENKTPEEIVDYLLYEKNIFITPGSIFGTNGKNYIRFSLCVNKEVIQEALERI